MNSETYHRLSPEVREAFAPIVITESIPTGQVYRGGQLHGFVSEGGDFVPASRPVRRAAEQFVSKAKSHGLTLDQLTELVASLYA